MFLLTQPQRYDVVVTTNMFGDILTDLASVLQGGMGMAVGCNLGDDHAMFEPIHGSAPPLAGKDRANPMAMLLATGEAFGWLGRRHADDRLVRAHRAVEAAVAGLVAAGAPLTADLVGPEAAAQRGCARCAGRRRGEVGLVLRRAPVDGHPRGLIDEHRGRAGRAAAVDGIGVVDATIRNTDGKRAEARP